MSKLKRTMRLGLLLGGAGCHPPDWRYPSVPADGDTDFKRLTHWAKVSEEAKLDFIFLGGVAAVSNLNHPRMARNPEQGHIQLEPLTLAAALAAVMPPGHAGCGSCPTKSTHISCMATWQLPHSCRSARMRTGWL